MPITPNRSAEILMAAFEARDRENARKEEMALRKAEQDARLSELNRKAMAEKRLQEALNVPTTREQTVQDPNAFNFLAREGADPSQFTTSERVPVPESDRMKQQIKNLVSVGDIQGAKQLQDIYEKQKDDQEAGVTYQYYLKNPSGWKQDMIRDFPDRAEDINKTSFTPDGRTLIYNDKERGGFWSRDVRTGKEEFKAYPKETVTAHNVIEVPSPDGKTAQKFQYNAKTNTYDIPVGQKYLVKSQVPNISVSLNKPTEEQAKGDAYSIAHGLMAPNTFLSKRGQSLNVVRQEVRNLYPDFNFNKAEANYKYMINPNNLRSIGLVKAAMPRVDDLENKINQISNTAGMPFIDKPLNEAKRAVGNVPIVDFESLRNAIIAEVNTALAGSSVQSDYRIKLELENLGSNRTPKQLKAAVRNLKAALEARADASVAIPYDWDEVRGEKKTKKTDTALKATHQYIPGKGIVEIK